MKRETIKETQFADFKKVVIPAKAGIQGSLLH